VSKPEWLHLAEKSHFKPNAKKQGLLGADLAEVLTESLLQTRIRHETHDRWVVFSGLSR
jgi:hypothetical protein